MSQEQLDKLLGDTLESIDQSEDEVKFTTVSGRKFVMTHYQDCCEDVYLEDVVGDIKDLLGSPILRAEEVTNDVEDAPDGRGCESYTWTFYKFETNKGSVTLRWFGESNGYYSESVDFKEIAA